MKWIIKTDGNRGILKGREKQIMIFIFALIILIGSFGFFYGKGKFTDTGCDDATHTSKQQCWEEKILTTLEKQDTADAFKLLAYFYATEPAFAKDCHGYTHYIGEKAYQLFSEGKEFTLTQETSYCGYGFYHGFMETMVQETGDSKRVREFCNYAREKTGSPHAWNACYHGFGHGVVDGSDPRAWGDIDAMLAPGFEFCREIGDTEFQYYLCKTGVYNAIEQLSTDPKYKIITLNEDPFSLCNTKEPPGMYREACYTNMIPAVLHLTQDDFLQAAAYIEENMKSGDELTIERFTVREMVILSLFHEFIRVHLEDDDYVSKGVSLCRSLPEHSWLACVEGLAGGHLKYGKPEEEHVKVLAFCQHDLLKEEERRTCFGYILPRMLSWRRPAQAREICALIDETYRKMFCQMR